jgi:phage gp29-like protein
MPTAVGKYPQGTDDKDVRKLRDALEALAQDMGVVIRDDMAIDFIEAQRAGSVDTYERLVKYMDEQITLCVLGEQMTTHARAQGLGSQSAEQHNDVRIELAKADADLLCETYNASLIPWLCEYNFPGLKPPKLQRVRAIKQQDLADQADRDVKIYSLGFEPTEQYIQETYGDGWVKSKARAPLATDPKAAGGLAAADMQARLGGQPAQFAEAPAFPDQEALDAVLAALPANELREQAAGLVKPVIQLIKDRADYKEAYDALAKAFPKMDTKGLETALGRALFVADVWGRLNANA